jgi:signal transduction histidine kinase
MRTIRRSCGGRLIWRADPATTGLFPDKAALEQEESRFAGLEGGIGPISLGSISPFRFCAVKKHASRFHGRSFAFPKAVTIDSEVADTATRVCNEMSPPAGKAAAHETPDDLALLVEASSRLLLAQSCQDVLHTTIELGKRFIAADGYALWQQNAGDQTWSLLAAAGLSEAFCQAHRLAPAREAPREPLIFEDVEKSPYLSTRHEVLRAEGIRSMLIIPLRVLDEQPGTMVFYWHAPVTFIAGKTKMAAVLGRLASCALRSAGTIERGTEELRRSQAALRRTNEELRRANEDLNQFARSASHDLQEPLRSISIYSELLRRQLGETLEPEAGRHLAYLMNSAARMEALIRDLLAWSSASGTPGQTSGLADANEAFETALLNLKTAVQDTSAAVTRGSLPDVPILPVHLSQVFQNLIGNAIKYRRREESPRVHVDAVPGQSMWQFSVADNGIGIDEKYTDQIFGVFKRLHTTEEYSGTGMGLAICQKYVERAGGRIWVESQPGRGSTFYFTLPAET